MLNARSRQPLEPSGSIRASDRIFSWLMRAIALALIAVLAGIAIQLVLGSIPAFRTFGLTFLTGTSWDPSTAVFGALPFIAGTLVSSSLAMLIAVPVGIFTALFLSEMAPRWLAVPLTFTVDLIAAIPSVIIGLWGLGVMSVFLRDVVEGPIIQGFGGLPFLGPDATGSDLLAASLVLALMVTPTMVAITREVFATVPQAHREAMIGIGGTRWETIRRVVLPQARSGVIGAAILALGRAIGETMAVTMTIGNADRIPSGLFAPAQTIASKIATSWNEASTGIETQSLIGLGLVLMVVSVTMVIATRTLLRGRRLARGEAFA